MSLCTTPCLWRYTSPYSTWFICIATKCSWNGPNFVSCSTRDPFSMYSRMMLRWCSEEKESMYLTM